MAEPENLVLKQLALLRDDMQAGFAALRDEQARTNDNVTAIARTLVTVERDLRIIQRDLGKLSDRVTVLSVAVDEHPPSHV